MCKSIEIEGRSIDEAVFAALNELEISEEEAEIEIIDEGNKGIFGLIGNRLAKVRVTKRENSQDKIMKFFNPIFDKMKIKPSVDISENEDSIKIKLSGDNIGIIIGRRGETLDALQYLVGLVINKDKENYKRIVLDVCDYRKNREDTLVSLSKRLAEKVIKSRRSITLEPMNPYERRIIHSTLQNNRYVETYSVGEEPNRKVVIKVK